jgi:hypothetical protein
VLGSIHTQNAATSPMPPVMLDQKFQAIEYNYYCITLVKQMNEEPDNPTVSALGLQL